MGLLPQQLIVAVYQAGQSPLNACGKLEAL